MVANEFSPAHLGFLWQQHKADIFPKCLNHSETFSLWMAVVLWVYWLFAHEGTHTFSHSFPVTDSHTHIKTQAHTHTHTQTCIHAYTNAHTKIHMHTLTHIDTYTHTNAHPHAYAHTHISVIDWEVVLWPLDRSLSSPSDISRTSLAWPSRHTCRCQNELETPYGPSYPNLMDIV